MDHVILVMGMGAAGKTTVTQQYLDQGYHRLNRDEIGGSLSGLEKHLQDAVSQGRRRVVMDNTYADKESRKGVIEIARTHGIPITCAWLTTSFEDAQLNACFRMIQRTGKLLMPDDFKNCKDPNLFPPVALFGYKKRFQKPTAAEGFDKVIEIPFVRQYPPEYTHSALILDCDGVLRHSKGKEKFPCKPEEVDAIPGRGEVVKKKAVGFDYLLGISNQSGVAKKKLTVEDVESCFRQTNKLQGLDIPWLYCPHNVPPISCYCRKPSSGLGAWVIHQYKLDPRKVVYVGDQTTDKTFAERCGFQFVHETEFFV
jgi:HAD superfamily hydrolase (TIGR01662 family)